MIQPAFIHKTELQKIYAEYIYKEKYKYYSLGVSTKYELEIDNSDWKMIQYCSIINNKIIGYFCAHIIRSDNKITEIGILNFIEDNDFLHKTLHKTLGIDLIKFFRMLYLDKNIHKIEWSVILNKKLKSRTEIFYDNIAEKYNGSIIGISHDAIKLRDGKYYDRKYYELIK